MNTYHFKIYLNTNLFIHALFYVSLKSIMWWWNRDDQIIQVGKRVKNLTHVLTRVDVNYTMVKNAFGTTTGGNGYTAGSASVQAVLVWNSEEQGVLVPSLKTQSVSCLNVQKESVCVRSWSKLLQGFSIKRRMCRERERYGMIDRERKLVIA